MVQETHSVCCDMNIYHRRCSMCSPLLLCRHRPVQYLNNIVEQDHRFVKKRIVAKQGFRALASARRTVDGYEAIHRMRKGQVRWLATRAGCDPGDVGECASDRHP